MSRMNFTELLATTPQFTFGVQVYVAVLLTLFYGSTLGLTYLVSFVLLARWTRTSPDDARPAVASQSA